MSLVADAETVLRPEIGSQVRDARRRILVAIVEVGQRIGRRCLPVVAHPPGDGGLQRVVIRVAVGNLQRRRAELRVRQVRAIGIRVVHASHRVVGQIEVLRNGVVPDSGEHIVAPGCRLLAAADAGIRWRSGS